MTSEHEEAPAEVPRERAADSTRRARIVVGVVAGAGLVAFFVVAFLASRPEAGCGDWDDQFDQVSEGLARYVRSKGDARVATLLELEALALPCAKVAKARDACAGVYRNLHQAEVEHQSAKQAIADLEKAIATLDGPVRDVAERRLIETEPTFVIAEKLGISTDEVRSRLDAALDALGRERVDAIHGRFEKSVNQSQEHVRAAKAGNATCDHLYKQLLEAEQSE